MNISGPGRHKKDGEALKPRPVETAKPIPEELADTVAVRKNMALGLLNSRDFVVIKAVTQGLTLSPEWLTWQESLRAILRGEDQPIEPEPERYISSSPPEAELPEERPEVGDDGIPEAFRSLMLDGESAEKFTERMRRRWLALQQYRVDMSKPTPSRALPDMTAEEDEELRDLEERNRRHRWLD